MLEVIAQANSQPEVYATTSQMVEVIAVEALTMKVTAYPRMTIPMGDHASRRYPGKPTMARRKSPFECIVGLLNNSAGERRLSTLAAAADWVVLNGARQASATLTREIEPVLVQPHERREVALGCRGRQMPPPEW